MEKASRRENFKYGDDTIKIYDGVTKYNSHIKGKSGIVIGSEDPWLEAILLHYGADKLLTVEFGKIFSEHPQLSTVTPKKFTEGFLNGEIEQFDFGMSFSSLEHDGSYWRFANNGQDVVCNPAWRSVLHWHSKYGRQGYTYLERPSWLWTDTPSSYVCWMALY
jgi:hypothetical protein